MYDLTRDPHETVNLGHARHSTAASAQERARLHQRLSDVMREKGTTPDEIRWPEVADFQPRTALADSDENGALDEDEAP
jgi:hypothetical protein